MSNENPTILFLCTRNSVRSQMAEALMRSMAGDDYTVYSAGLEPSDIHPMTHQVMEEVGISLEGHRPKSSCEFLGRVSIRYAIIVCNQVEDHCPQLWPFCSNILKWPFDDPASEEHEKDSLEEFRRVRDELEMKITCWLKSHG